MDDVADFLDVLTERQRNVVHMRFGIDGQSPMTYAEIAKELGVSTVFARAYCLGAIWKMKVARDLKDDDEWMLKAMDPDIRSAWEHHMGWATGEPLSWREVRRITGVVNAKWVAEDTYRALRFAPRRAILKRQ